MKDISVLRKRNLKAWIQVDDEVSILARHISQAEWEEVRTDCTAMTVSSIPGQEKKEVDEIRFRHEIGRRAVLDVRGLVDGDSTDESGEALPFAVTPENIDLLMDEWTEFRMAVMSTPLSFKLMQDLARAQLIKN